MDNGECGAFAYASDGARQAGLTKREYFAVLAMQGMLSNPDNDGDREIMMQEAVKNADELLNALSKSK